MTITRAYYNEIDPYCCQWLENLISAGSIPPGDVDYRPIEEISFDEILGYTQYHFFAGIGGWAYACRLAGWPDDRPIWTGSCPCQPFSAAGRRQGIADKRHLWPEFYRLVNEAVIAECQPAIIFGEQVASKDGRIWLHGVRSDLEALGYAVGAADLCAAGIGAPHIRQRLYWVGQSTSAGSLPGTFGGIYCGEKVPGAWNGQSERPGSTGGMAESMSTGWAQRRANAGDGSATGGGGTGGLADRCSPGLAGRPQQPAWEECTTVERDCAVGGLADSSSERRQQDTRGPSCDEGAYGTTGWKQCEPDGNNITLSDGTDGIGRLAVPGSQRAGWGLYGPGEGTDTVAERSSDQFGGSGSIGPWSDYDIIPCADGKSRRVESGTFPLVAGLSSGMGSVRPGEDSPYRAIKDPKTGKNIGQAPWRIGMLKGYGNSIVPQLAAEFITAYMEAQVAIQE